MEILKRLHWLKLRFSKKLTQCTGTIVSILGEFKLTMRPLLFDANSFTTVERNGKENGAITASFLISFIALLLKVNRMLWTPWNFQLCLFHIQLSLNLSSLRPKSLLQNLPVQLATSVSDMCARMHTHTHTHTQYTRTVIPTVILHPHTKAMVYWAWSSFLPAPRHIVHYWLVTWLQLFWFFHLYAEDDPSNKWKEAVPMRKSACVCVRLCGGGNDGFKKVRDCWHGRWECFHLVTRNSTEIWGEDAGWIM